MEFKDKYISAEEKKEFPLSIKKVISDDAYAISEQIDNLIKQIQKTGFT